MFEPFSILFKNSSESPKEPRSSYRHHLLITQTLTSPDPNRLPIRPLSLSKNSFLIVKDLFTRSSPPALTHDLADLYQLHLVKRVVFSTLRLFQFQLLFRNFFQTQLFKDTRRFLLLLYLTASQQLGVVINGVER